MAGNSRERKGSIGVGINQGHMLYTLGLKVGIIYILGPSGIGLESTIGHNCRRDLAKSSKVCIYHPT